MSSWSGVSPSDPLTRGFAAGPHLAYIISPLAEGLDPPLQTLEPSILMIDELQCSI